ncbi:MAG TPA: conjugal transfer protein TraG [Hyphomonas sp.]|uniref:IncP-type conjugal transfer protein TraG n=1 Tax=Hyphomonas sp. UBA5107 TaxID=1946636 RepID=UPI000C50A560|nr:conjugal transfer protein TraG [Hyphomonas sp.]MAN65581.1 conjugal transfer protein TraG [Hyphomonadaceae bacterium]HBL93835.1 conjugal transfer protein TraG [Hyphomonas sp.]HCJ16859.1 conjugal transfer protein TraG [Hyphomonas sp.]HCN92002.1 conjugal transfer protein TraG [Hyphomonas sp.]
MTPTKFLIGQFLLTLVLITCSVWGATQWVAGVLEHQPRLGSSWFEVYRQPVYKPWRLFQWWYAYDAYAPDVFARAGLIASLGGIAGIGMAILASLWRARREKHATTYGSARWASTRDVRKAGLFGMSGIVLGRFRGRYLRHAGAEHVMAFAPTRSGKGVGLVIPTLLSWTGTSIIHDIKGENWSLTSKWRSGFSRCIRFDPTDLASSRFNPLLEIRLGAQEVRDAQNVADILVDPEGSLERRNHWDKTAHSLLVGAILHVLYAEDDKSLAGVATLLSDPARPIDETLERMLDANHLGSRDRPLTHPVVAEAARELLNKSENEKSSVVSTAISFLGLFRDPVVQRATSGSDWQIADLFLGQRPASLYLVVPPSDLSRTKPLIRLILNQIARRLCEELPEGQDRRQTLLMLDEFPALGRLDFFETSLAFMAGYGVRAFLIAQSLNQVEKAYGQNHSILDNCHVRIAFATNDERTAKRVSDMLGTMTEQRNQKNYTGHRLAPWLSHVMVSQQETQRPLMTPGEIMQMPAGDALIFLASHPPIKARKLRYFEDQNFIDRVGGLERPAACAPGPGLVGLPVPRPSLAAMDSRGLARRLDPDLTGDQERLKEGEDSEPIQRDPGSVQDQIARYYARLQDRGGREL